MKSFQILLLSLLIILLHSTPLFAQSNNGQAQAETCSAFSFLTITKSDRDAFRDGWRDLFDKDAALYDQLTALGASPNPTDLDDIMRDTCWRYANGSAEDFIRNIKNKTYGITEAGQTPKEAGENKQDEQNINENIKAEFKGHTTLREALRAKAEKEAGIYPDQRLSLKDGVKDDTFIKERMAAKTDIAKQQKPNLDVSPEILDQTAGAETDSNVQLQSPNQDTKAAPPMEGVGDNAQLEMQDVNTIGVMSIGASQKESAAAEPILEDLDVDDQQADLSRPFSPQNIQSPENIQVAESRSLSQASSKDILMNEEILQENVVNAKTRLDSWKQVLESLVKLKAPDETILEAEAAIEFHKSSLEEALNALQLALETKKLEAEKIAKQDTSVKPASELGAETETETETETGIQLCSNTRNHYAVDKKNVEELAELSEINGVSYINSRLMTQAFESVSAISKPLQDDICEKTSNAYVEPSIDITKNITANCGCTVARKENSLIYAFFPLDESHWLPVEDAPKEGGQEDPSPKNLPQIDFEFIDRISIDGLYLDSKGKIEASEYWYRNAKLLTVQAHKHRAKIDLAIHVPELKDWNNKDIEQAVSSILTVLGHSKQDPSGQPESPLFNKKSVTGLDKFINSDLDGVTLIIEGYDGKVIGNSEMEAIYAEDRNAEIEVDPNPNADNIVRLVNELNEKLRPAASSDNNRKALRSNLTINLAFDIDLGNAEKDAYDGIIFDDLGTLFVSPIDGDGNIVGAPIVDKILIFLQRPTADSREILRERIARSFTEKNQTQVLRNIIPVISPGGHKELGRIDSVGKKIGWGEYGQLKSDILYFQDNFNGVGFWPAPFLSKPKDFDEIKAFIQEEFRKSPPNSFLSGKAAGGICKVACLNRVPIAIIITISMLAAILLTILSHFNLTVYKISYKFYAVPIFVVIALLLLIALFICDKQSNAYTLKAIIIIIVVSIGAFVFNWYNRKVSGPMP